MANDKRTFTFEGKEWQVEVSRPGFLSKTTGGYPAKLLEPSFEFIVFKCLSDLEEKRCWSAKIQIGTLKDKTKTTDDDLVKLLKDAQLQNDEHPC